MALTPLFETQFPAKNANAVMDIVRSLFAEEGESYERGNQNHLAISSRFVGIVPGI